MIAVGNCLVPTSGREFVTFMFGGASGFSSISVGLVDLRTGDMLWLNNALRVGSGLFDAGELQDREEVESLVRSLFSLYPGIELYREMVAK